jgi:hypothetical protein
MPTERMQTSEASTTKFKDDTMELDFFYSILDKQNMCKILKVYDNEGAEILILILCLEMENIAVKLSKHLVVI